LFYYSSNKNSARLLREEEEAETITPKSFKKIFFRGKKNMLFADLVPLP
jgi:hypothetical protein